jgi:hypothetical protein
MDFHMQTRIGRHVRDNGVAVYCQAERQTEILRLQQIGIPFRDNMRAIQRTIEALRGMNDEVAINQARIEEWTAAARFATSQ